MSDVQTRRLAAIVAADVVGYTGLTEKAEGTVHSALMHLRADIIDPVIKRYRGRIVKNTGDGFLCEFASVLDATQFAIDIQLAISSRNSEVPDLEKLTFRVGINVSDIIVEPNDIYGEGVNIAVRLEGISAVGGIAVSESVYAAVRNRLPIRFASLGLKKLKNIEEPVRVYRIVDVNGVRLGRRRRHLGFWRTSFAAAAVVLISLVSGIVWQSVRETPPSAVSVVSDAALPLPEKPSVAVLPFANLSGNAGQEYFSDGITEDLITYLSKFPRLFVIAKNSSFRYKGATTSVEQIGRELGVRYLIEGSVRKDGNALRINTHLVDTQTGRQVWSERYDGDISDIFALQDRIASKIVNALVTNLTPDEQNPTLYPAGTMNVQAYDAYLHGWEYYRRRTQEAFKEAIASFRRAVELDPDYAEAHAAMAATYAIARLRLWHGALGLSSRYKAESLARAALTKSMRRPTSLGYRVAARLLYFEYRHDEAIDQINKAIAMDPNDPDNYWVKATALVWGGRAKDALTPLQVAMRLDPHFPARYLAYQGIAKFALNQFDEAAADLERAIGRRDDEFLPWLHLVAAYGYLGRLDDAQRGLEQLNAFRDRFYSVPLTLASAKEANVYKEASDQNRLLTGLRLAGVPDRELTKAAADWPSRSYR